MSFRAVRSPLAPKITSEHGSRTLRAKSSRHVSNSSKGSGCSMREDNDQAGGRFQSSSAQGDAGAPGARLPAARKCPDFGIYLSPELYHHYLQEWHLML